MTYFMYNVFLKSQVLTLSSDLDLKMEAIDADLSLLERQKLLSNYRTRLSETVSGRIERFKSLSSENKRICEKLGEQPKEFSFVNVPSSQLLESMDDEINVLLLKLFHTGDAADNTKKTSPNVGILLTL